MAVTEVAVQGFRIPQNIEKWLKDHDGVNLSINFNNASADCGYAHIMWLTVEISMLNRRCNRCGYDLLWNPDDRDSKCLRHTYDAWHYDTVFAWCANHNEQTLSEAFDEWEKSQPKAWMQPVKRLYSGTFGWR